MPKPITVLLWQVKTNFLYESDKIEPTISAFGLGFKIVFRLIHVSLEYRVM